MSDDVHLKVWFLGGPHDGIGPVFVKITKQEVEEKRFTYEGVEYRIQTDWVPDDNNTPKKRTYLIHPHANGLFEENA